MSGGQRFTARMSIFNVTNANTVLAVTRLSSARFGLPESILPPRIAEFSVSYSF